MARKKTEERFVAFPEKLINKVNDIEFEKKLYKNHSFRLLHRIFQNYDNKGTPLNQYISLSKNYIKKVIGSEYHRIMKYLKDNEIIEVQMSLDEETGQLKESYSTTYHKSKYYRLNQKLIFDKNFKNVSYKDIEENLKIDPKLLEYQKNIIKKIIVDTENAIKDINTKNKITLQDIRVNDNIIEEYFEVTNLISNKKHFVNKIDFLLRGNGKLIEYKNKYFIVKSIEDFFDEKNQRIIYHNTNSLKKLDKKFIRVSRNETNNRLDTNLTNLSNKLIKHLSISKESLYSIDLNNSQFTLLSDIIYKIINNNINKIKDIKGNNPLSIIDLDLFSSILTNKNDVNRFIELTSNGKLYEYIQEKLNLRSRNEAKNLMFEVLFSSYRFNSSSKNKIKELFPNIFEFVKEFKKKYGDNSFVIMLQRYESMIFIDNVLYKAMNQNFDMLTKHDSILIKYSDREKGNNILKGELDKILDVNYKLSYTDYSKSNDKYSKDYDPTGLADLLDDDLEDDYDFEEIELI
ncbi:MAG: hypothetical protein ACOC33_00075 [bacterium]